MGTSGTVLSAAEGFAGLQLLAFGGIFVSVVVSEVSESWLMVSKR